MTECRKLGEAYYTLVGAKDVEGVKGYLDEKVELYSPLGSAKGKGEVVEATKNFMQAIRSLQIRAAFGNHDQAMVVYDVDMPGVSPRFQGASLMTIREGKIIKIELIYDSRPVVQKKEEIFS